MSIGSNIQLARKFLNMTQKELADKINKTESSIKKYETGITNVPLNVLETISEVFNIPKDTLIGSEDVLRFYLLLNKESSDDSSMRYYKDLIFNNILNTYAEKMYELGNEHDIDLISDSLVEYQAANITKKSTKYEIHHDKPLSQKDKLNNSLIELITYANKNTPVELTERQQDVLFDDIIDYIRYKLYSMGK